MGVLVKEMLAVGGTKGFFGQMEMHRLSAACAEVVRGVPRYVLQVVEVDTASIQMELKVLMGPAA